MSLRHRGYVVEAKKKTKRGGYKFKPTKRRVSKKSGQPSLVGVWKGKKQPISKEALLKAYAIFKQSPGRKFKIPPTNKFYRAVLSLAARGKVARQGNMFWMEK